MSNSITENPFWIYAQPSAAVVATMPLGQHVGKWCIFVQSDDLDDVWARVERATKAGKLWHGSKVSTEWAQTFYLMRNRNADPKEHVICVYTYDANDEADVMRVREELRKIGITQPLGYKTDADTGAGRERWTYADEGWAR